MRSRYFHITLQPLSEDDALGGFLLLIPGHPDGYEQGSHQGDLKVLVIKNMMRLRIIMEMMMMMMMVVMVVVTEQLPLPEPVLKSGAFARARIWLPHQHAEHSDLMLKMHLPYDPLHTCTFLNVVPGCRTYTMTSTSDGSSSTIMVDEWQPVFDRFDLESDGKMVLIDSY